MPANNDYLVEAENGFIGMVSRLNPLELQPGQVQYAQNMRFDLGVAEVRRGTKRLTSGGVVEDEVLASGTFLNANGNECIIMVVEDGIYVYNTTDETTSIKIDFPAGRTVSAADAIDVVQANNVAYIFRGAGDPEQLVTSASQVDTTVFVDQPDHGYTTGDEIIITGATPSYCNGSFIVTVLDSDDYTYAVDTTATTALTGTIYAKKAKSPLVWDGATTITVVPQGNSTPGASSMPPSDFGMYFKNRLVVKQSRDRLAASNYLDYNSWDLDFDQFVINLGANDYIVGFQPWQEDRFIVFQRNSLYYAYIDPNAYSPGSAPGGNSFVQTLTAEFGCAARKSIVNAGEYIFFLSDNGVYLLNPSLDLKLLGNTTPLSDPITNIMSRINANYVSRAVAKVFNNRYYLAVPVDGSTRNNAVLVYSMLNKAWESVDVYPEGFYIDSFVVALYGETKRLYITNVEGGIFLTEENDYDEFDGETGGPVLPFVLPAEITTSFTQFPISGFFRTRRYFYNTYAAKRFSSGAIDVLCNAGDSLTITAEVSNPDNTSEVLNFSSSSDEGYTKRFRIAMRGFGLDLVFRAILGRPTVRGLRVEATVPGRQVISED